MEEKDKTVATPPQQPQEAAAPPQPVWDANAPKPNKQLIKNRPVAYITKIAMLGALAFLIHLFRMPIIPGASWLDMEFASVITLIGGFVLGPWSVFGIEGIKIVLMILIKGTSTGYVGELSNFINSVCFALPAAIIYTKKKGVKWVILGLAISIVIEVLVSIATNYYIMIPLFSKFLPAEFDYTWYYLVAVPVFNLIKFGANSIVAFFLYKGAANYLKKI